jgi:hypothetical protein
MLFTNFNFFSILIFFISFFIILYIFLYFLKKYKEQQKNFFLLYKNKKFKLFFLKLFLIFFSIFILFFNIFWIKYWQWSSNKNIKWLDIVFILDVSKSMNVADINWKTRLEYSKNMIKNYIKNHNYNRYWLIIFSWNALAISPLTTNYPFFLSFLDSVNYKNLTQQWTNFYEAFDFAIKRFLTNSKNPKTIVFISDWWDTTKIDLKNLNKEVKKKNILVEVIWIWTKKWGKIPNWYNINWEQDFVIYNWDYIISKLNEKNLKKIASFFNWDYFSNLDNIDRKLDLIEKKTILNHNTKYKKDFTKILIIISFFFFLFSLFIINKKWN